MHDFERLSKFSGSAFWAFAATAVRHPWLVRRSSPQTRMQGGGIAPRRRPTISTLNLLRKLATRGLQQSIPALLDLLVVFCTA